MGEPCFFHKIGHCKRKQKCEQSHEIPICKMGLFCESQDSCIFRHVRPCKFQPCLYSKCSYSHDPPPLLPPLLPIPRPALHPPTYHHTLLPPILHSHHQPPCHPPPGLPHGNPHTFPYGAASTPAVEDKPDLEVLDGAMNKFLDNAVIWSEQLEALSKHSEQQAKLVTDMVGTLEREMEELRTKVSKLEKEIAKKINTVTKEEMEHKFAGIAKEVGRVATLEKAVSKLEEDRANIKPDSYYLDLIEKQTAKKSVAQNNEIASISSKVTALGKVVTQHTTTLEHDLMVKVTKLQKEVAKKINSEGNDNSATDTQSIIKKIAVIEQNLQAMDTQIGKQFLGNDTRLTTIENHNRCKNCKSNPCLDGKPITSENFVHKAYYKGSAGTKKNSIYGHTYIGGFGEYQGEKYTGKWICYSYLKDIFPREEFTQAFTENVKSLKFSCHR